MKRYLAAAVGDDSTSDVDAELDGCLFLIENQSCLDLLLHSKADCWLLVAACCSALKLPNEEAVEGVVERASFYRRDRLWLLSFLCGLRHEVELEAAFAFVLN